METERRTLTDDRPAGTILARMSESISDAGERYLVERLHQILDESGSSAIASFSNSLLPDLQALALLLPTLLRDEADRASIAAVQHFGTTLQERGVSLHAIVDEGVVLHDRLLREVGMHVRQNDQALITAIRHLSRALLALGQSTLLAYYEQATIALAQLAHTDGLTGLANRRYFEIRLGEEIHRAQRIERPLALMLIDLDGLKAANDSFGHAVGDELLRAVASVLNDQARNIDVAARIGGDEFALVLPETDRTGAEVLLTRLRQGVEVKRVGDQSPRFSAGVAVYPNDGQTATELMAYADGALYQAKRLTSA